MKFINHLYHGSFHRYLPFELEERVMKKKLDINKVDNNMFTPLSFLAKQGEFNCVVNLIEKKFNLIDWQILDEILSLKSVLKAIIYSDIVSENKQEIIQKINEAYPLKNTKIEADFIEQLAYKSYSQADAASFKLFSYVLSSPYIEKLNEFYEKEYFFGKPTNLFSSVLYGLNKALENQDEKTAKQCANLISLLVENDFKLCFFQEKERLSSSNKREYNTLFSDKSQLNAIIYLIENITFPPHVATQFLDYWFECKSLNLSKEYFSMELEKAHDRFYIDALNKKYKLTDEQIDQATLIVIKNNLDLNLLNSHYTQCPERIQKMFKSYGNEDKFNIWQEKILLENTLNKKTENKKIKI